MVAVPYQSTVTVLAVEAAFAAKAERGQDMVVRASAIGKCSRHLWYRFRWAHQPESFEPRILRLFETGHIEEARMIGWLEAAGIEVESVDPATGEQWEWIDLDGHFAGHLDGKAINVPEAPKTPHLLECKTHNAKSFAQVVKHGVQISKPEHYAQMQIYMHEAGLTRALYLAKNKDTDELHSERIDYDPAEALRLLAKAARVIRSHEPPARLSEDPDWFECRFCHSHSICHQGQAALRNCRTCLHSTPIPDGLWQCAQDGSIIGQAKQEVGCPAHRLLPGLVPGEQIDLIEGDVVVYRMADGSLWQDSGLEQADA